MKKNMTGVQGCIEGILTAKKLDEINDIKTSFVISGYRGSPLAPFDKECWKRQKEFNEHNIRFINGLNEELALAAVAGTQQFQYFGKPKDENKDGAAGFWYAKGPGVDRAMDSIHHYAYQGTTKFGGVVLFCGNDTIMSSSTMPHDTSITLATIHIPVLAPSNVEELIEFTVKGLYLSRYSGSYVAISVVTELADSYQTVDTKKIFDNLYNSFHNWKELMKTHDNGGFCWPDDGDLQEKRIYEKRIPLIKKFITTYPFDKLVRFENNEKGIICVGKCHEDLKVFSQVYNNANIDILKLGCIYPLNKDLILKFTKNKKEILVIEEKDPFVENQIKQILFDEHIDVVIHGKDVLTPLKGLDLKDIAKALNKLGYLEEKDIPEYKSLIEDKQKFQRIPYFCGGCPHNTGTKLPEGEMAILGIGCHYLASFMPDRPTITVCPMGAEGASWISISQLSNRDHLFINLGDGTYYHSGSLSIRFAVATKTKVTFKILYNNAVAMTGGQPVDGPLTIESLIEQLYAEGVKKVVVVTHYYDDKNYRRKLLELGVEVYPKNKIIDVQKELKKIDGVTVLIYDQMCATEKRRKEKRGLLKKTTDMKMFLNQEICDACGDCQKKSNCMAIGINYKNPYLPTRYIDETLCNDDFSCKEGFCPSFGMFKFDKNKFRNKYDPLKKVINVLNEKENSKALPYSQKISILGIGGTGTSTLTKIVADSLLDSGYYVSASDKTGLAQRFGEIKGIVHANTFEMKKKIKDDIVIVLDPMTLLNHEICGDNVIYIINSKIFNIPTVIHQPENISLYKQIEEKINQIPENQKYVYDFTSLSEEVFGTKQYTNMIMLGFCIEKIPHCPLDIKNVINNIKRIMNKFSEDNISALLLGTEIAKNTFSLKEKKNFSFEDILQKYDRSGKTLEEFEMYKKHIEMMDLNENLKQRLLRAIFDLIYVKDEYEVSRLWLKFFKENNIKQGFVYVSLYGKKKHKIPVFLAKYLFFVLDKLSFLRNTSYDIHLVRKSHRKDKKYRQMIKRKIDEYVLYNGENLNENDIKYLENLLGIVERIRGYGHIREDLIKKHVFL